MGLTPAMFLYVGAVVAYLLTSLVRIVTSGLGFLTQLPTVNVAIMICLLLLAVGYVFVAIRAFRQARNWRAFCEEPMSKVFSTRWPSKMPRARNGGR